MTFAVYDALPGLETPVAKVRQTLADMWSGEALPGQPEPSEFRASQMNFVIHLGLEATPAVARASFDDVMAFSRVYPCRMIVLLPHEDAAGAGIRAKIFCECFLGSSHRERVCTEAIVLTYPLSERAFLEDQTSVLLESDLPLGYWPQRIQKPRRIGDYGVFLREASRIVVDSAAEKAELLAFPWPRRERVRDLAYTRLLPLRQSIGHFLSYLSPTQLVSGLERVDLAFRPGLAAESRNLIRWMEDRLRACCGECGGDDLPASFSLEEKAGLEDSIDCRWRYAGGGALTFRFDFEVRSARLESSLGGEKTVVHASIDLLPPAQALAEAMFF